MGGRFEGAFERGVARELSDLRRRVRALETGNPLESASIGTGGLRLVGGTLTVDEGGDIHITGGRLVAGDADGVRAEITDVGYQLINEDGQVDIALTTNGAINQIRLRGAVDDSTEVLLTNEGDINGRVLNVDEIFLDGQNLGELLSGNDIIDPSPSPGDQTDTYTATFSHAYRSNGQQNDFVNGGGLTQGRFDSTNGNQRSIIGFNTSQIQADLAGRTVTRVRVRLYFYHWFNNSGGTAVLGHHGHTSLPGTFSATQTDVVRSSGWPKPGRRWVVYDHSLQAWATGAKTGIVLGPGPSTSKTYYGIARGHNQSSPPQLEIRSTA